MSDFREHLERKKQDPLFSLEYDNMEAERAYMRAILSARLEQNLTQAELAERSGIRQSNLSRIETGACSPTVSTLQQIASGLGKRLKIEFV